MSKARWIVALLALCLTVPLVFANDTDSTAAKLESAKKVLAQSVAKLAKTKSLAVKLDVQGGISQSKDHALSETTVRESYEASIYKGIMHLPKQSAYRTAKAGAISAGGGNYQQILASKEGAKIDRLFGFPLEILSEAANTGLQFEWMDGGERIVEEGGEGKTGVLKKERLAPTRMRVEVPEKVGLDRFTKIQNSGAISDC
ncbi:MAG: hypothetical protein ACKVX7_04415 [Planctomycetota bacterium]